MIKKRLLDLLKDSKKYIVYHVLWQWCAMLANMAAVGAVGMLLGHILEGHHELKDVGLTAGVVIGAVIVRFVCDQQTAKAAYKASSDVKRILRTRIYEKLLKLGPSYHEKAATSEIVQVSVEGIEQLEIYFGSYLPQLFYSLLAPMTLFAVLSFVSLKASGILLICVPLIPVSIVAVQKFAKRLLHKYWGIYTELGDSFLENLQGLTTLKIYQSDEMKSQEMDREAERFRKVTMKVLTMQLNSISVMDLVAYGGAAVGMAVTVSEYLSGQINFAGAFALILLASEFFIPLRLLGSFFHIAMNGMAASDKIFKILDMEEPADGTLNVGENVEISLENVGFCYTPRRKILDDISMTIPQGTLVALVGKSGCGKSTIASLLTGRNKGYTGNIQIGGVCLSDIRTENLMKNVTLVNHNSYLFKGTVAQNLRMGKPEATDEELEHVLREVNLWAFFSGLAGLETTLTERASNLSGGQCQRLAMARALLHDTPVYILDEATSNIDVESEEQIMEVVRKLAREKTVILISHRLANVVDADQIYVMDQGHIVGQGTHEQLMAAEGIYRELYTAQRYLENYAVSTKAVKGGQVQ